MWIIYGNFYMVPQLLVYDIRCIDGSVFQLLQSSSSPLSDLQNRTGDSEKAVIIIHLFFIMVTSLQILNIFYHAMDIL